MAFQPGQKVRIKPTSAFARFTGADVLTVRLVNTKGDTVCVSKGGRGAHWVGAEDLVPAEDEKK
jgi:hypothetical protein